MFITNKHHTHTHHNTNTTKNVHKPIYAHVYGDYCVHRLTHAQTVGRTYLCNMCKL